MSIASRFWALRRTRPTFVAVTTAFLVFLFAYPFIDWVLRAAGIAGPFGFYDFGAYGGAVNRWLAGEAIYVPNENGGYHQKYLYPPITLLVFWPFTELAHARILWNSFSVALLWLGLQAVVAALDVHMSRLERGLLLWLLLGFQPLLLSLKLAQTAPFLAGLLSFSLAALLRGEFGHREFRYASGLCTAIVGAVKPSYSSVGAHLLADRDRLGGALATGIGLLIASMLLFGVETHVAYLDVLTWGLHHGDSARSPALWLAPYFKPLAWIPGSIYLRIGASLLIAIGALMAASDADREVFALGVVAFPLLSPLTYAYYFVPVIPAIVVMLAVEFERDGYPLLPVLGLWILAIHSYGLRLLVVDLPDLLGLGNMYEPLYPLLQPGTWGLILLIGLAGYRVAETIERPAWSARW